MATHKGRRSEVGPQGGEIFFEVKSGVLQRSPIGLDKVFGGPPNTAGELPDSTALFR